MIGQAFARLKLMFAEGVGTLIGADKVQVKVLDGELLSNINRIEMYGVSHRAKPGCQAYLVFPHGDRSYGVALIIGDKRYQMDLAEGEVGLHDDEGNWVHIKRGGTIEVKASTEVVADTPKFRTTGDAQVGGNLVVMGSTVSSQGYYGEGGGMAKMSGGLEIDAGGRLIVNGKDCGDTHFHLSAPPGEPTSEVVSDA